MKKEKRKKEGKKKEKEKNVKVKAKKVVCYETMAVITFFLFVNKKHYQVFVRTWGLSDTDWRVAVVKNLTALRAWLRC